MDLVDQIVQRLIQSSPIRLKADPPIRQSTNGPNLVFCQVACMDCQSKMKSNWIRLSFVQGQEEMWETNAQEKLKDHITGFHKGDV